MLPLMKTVLVVDDERNIVELVRLYLEKEGFAVTSASDGEQALVAFDRAEPDLVILDLMLPKMDGFEVCRSSAAAATSRSSCSRPAPRISTRSSGSSWAPTTT
jgi:DNA-binding response OmpR family regulator